MDIRKQLTSWASESLHICAHTRRHPLDISRGIACWSLSLTLRTLIYDFSLAAPTHQCDSAPSCIIMNSSIKCLTAGMRSHICFMFLPQLRRECTQFLWNQDSHVDLHTPKKYFKCLYRFWKDSKTVVLCKYKHIYYLIIAADIMSLISVSRSGNGFMCSLSLILNLSIWAHVQKLAEGQWKLKLKQWALTFSIILTEVSGPLISLRN